ncbi:MAG: RICIN domain-containing protein [Actinomycetota bacterium]|nr:RICIN domain-containing protein [Actinomycetota bacterium]
MAGLLALSGSVVSAAPARAGASTTVTALVALHSQKLLDVRGASHAAGADLVQWSFNNGDNQRWSALPFSSIGGFDLVILQSVESGLVLDVSGSSTANGAPIVQTPWAGKLSQLWITLPLANESPFYVIVNVNSSRVLDVAGASLAEGAPVIQWNWHGGTNQIWSKIVFTVTNP